MWVGGSPATRKVFFLCVFVCAMYNVTYVTLGYVNANFPELYPITGMIKVGLNLVIPILFTTRDFPKPP